ncbi:hypothetical protein PYW08_002977 [Mythimna loreyi]|uniref:Uncharacterized protein n=1 Tax=Mythimna loreyi TaxID=667449 RepID=A0ACC2QQ30_9NEOP|nr:hypothetical protein PYW08_002977 [Mythimna loreyi]
MSDSDTNVSLTVQHFSKKMIATRELIRLVRQHQCLWDRCHPSYREKAGKDKAWHDIYLEFEPAYDTFDDHKKNLIGNVITRKWYNVRDSYVKSRKPGIRRPYVYADELTFLDPIYLAEGDRKSNKSYIEERMDNEDDGDHENSHNWLQEVFVDIDECADTQVADNPAKRPKLEYGSVGSSKEESEENIIAVLANLIQKEEDEDRSFFKSITPSVKKLSESSKFEFRIQVMKLINSLKLRDRQVMKLKRERTSTVDSDSE